MTIIEALILGLIQGLTEFLPVSSSGHIEIGKVLLGVESSDNLLFVIVVHAATVLSTIVIFRKDIWNLILGVFAFKWNEETQFLSKIALSIIPAGIIGVAFEDQIESFFDGKIILVGSMLLLTGALLYLSTLKKNPSKDVNFWDAFIIGCAQAMALFPGLSRSGSTISTALMLGIDREKAARFSFLMVLVPIMGATFLKILKAVKSPDDVPVEWLPLIMGFIAAFVFGLLACQWMIALVKRGKLIYFAIYCGVVGLICIVVPYFGYAQ